MKLNGYEVNITISPLPRNCKECPFLYNVWENCMEGATYCTLAEINLFGCFVERPKNCPLVEGKIKTEPPTEKQVEYAEQIAYDKDLKLDIAYTKQAYWEFINKYKDKRKGVK